MGREQKTAGRANYRVVLDKAVVAALRVIAAKETLASTSGCVTWVDVLRRAAAAAAADGSGT